MEERGEKGGSGSKDELMKNEIGRLDKGDSLKKTFLTPCILRQITNHKKRMHIYQHTKIHESPQKSPSPRGEKSDHPKKEKERNKLGRKIDV